MAWDRLAGLNNNPVRYSDPSGHAVVEDGSMSSSTCITTKTPDGKVANKTEDGKECIEWHPPLSNSTSGSSAGWTGTATINVPPFTPSPSLPDEDPTKPKHPFVAFGDFLGVLGDFLSLFAPPNTSTVNATLSYSMDSNGNISLANLMVENGTSVNIQVNTLNISTNTSGPFAITQTEKTPIYSFVTSGQSETFNLSTIVSQGAFAGVKLAGVTIRDNGAFFFLIIFSKR